MVSITEVLAESPIKSDDSRGFCLFALRVRALVGMLDQLGKEGRAELECGSHVSRLLSQLPHDMRANFRRFINSLRTPIPILLDFAEWLQTEVRIQEDEGPPSHSRAPQARALDRHGSYPKQGKASSSTMVLLGCDLPAKRAPPSTLAQASSWRAEKPQMYCPFCDTIQHYFNQCTAFKQLSVGQKVDWIKSGKRCWRCVRDHQAAPTSQCLLTSTLSPAAELPGHTSKFRLRDVQHHWTKTVIIYSKQDTTAGRILEERPIRVEMDYFQQQATPFLQEDYIPQCQASQQAVLGHLQGTQNQLSKDPVRVDSTRSCWRL